MSSPAITDPAAVEAELARLLASPSLRNSVQLRKLLEFLVTETLAGRGDTLKEYHLGLAVFQRGVDFDPRLDSIVRVQASMLRKKIEGYYAQAEAGPGAVRMRLPRGSYVPEWSIVDITPVPVVAPPPPTRRWLLAGGGAAAGAVVTAAILRPKPAPAPPAPGFWRAFLNPSVETIVSYGVPLFFSGKNLYVRDVSVNRLADRANGWLAAVERLTGDPLEPHDDTYTGVGEAEGVHRISQFLERRGVTATVANSHYLGPPDLSGKNLVVVASMRFQTLLDSLDLPHAFEFEGGGPGALKNLRPLPGEPALFSGGPPQGRSYARITLWPSASPEQRILYLSGRETWATAAAVSYLLDPESAGDCERRLAADPENGPRGRRSPYWEVLLAVERNRGEAPRSRYLTHRYLDVRLPLRFR